MVAPPARHWRCQVVGRVLVSLKTRCVERRLMSQASKFSRWWGMEVWRRVANLCIIQQPTLLTSTPRQWEDFELRQALTYLCPLYMVRPLCYSDSNP
ncbi:hypothetical protein TNCV_2630151 [Trichonephila clavipes]|uniref:Uncharacterized protein n=1 Tax=Trichonephila clavipes TaxID=2585209 RepID=A0A8X6SNW8_TRICX|nr:hypothetical protein TNCV_2630151 [Trichonephila clavipes]